MAKDKVLKENISKWVKDWLWPFFSRTKKWKRLGIILWCHIGSFGASNLGKEFASMISCQYEIGQKPSCKTA
jgi:hypothetical protein